MRLKYNTKLHRGCQKQRTMDKERTIDTSNDECQGLISITANIKSKRKTRSWEKKEKNPIHYGWISITL